MEVIKMTEILKQIEDGVKRVNSIMNDNRMVLKKSHNSYTLYCLDSDGRVLMTLTFSDELTDFQAFNRLRLISNIFL
jgi:hypothetical protein